MIENPFIKLKIKDTISLNKLQACFCIDTSASTGNIFFKKWSYLFVERMIIKDFFLHFEKKPHIISWNNESNVIYDLENITNKGYTEPSCIITNDSTKKILEETDILFLITDGNIGNEQVRIFSNLMREKTPYIKSVIGIIVGRRNDKNNNLIKPIDINTSVLVSSIITDGCILYSNTKKLYILWSNGIFKDTWKPNNININTTWKEVSVVSKNNILDMKINIFETFKMKKYFDRGYFHFYNGTMFSPKIFLVYNPSWEELLNIPYNAVCIFYKISQKYMMFCEWLEDKKKKFQIYYSIDNKSKKMINEHICNNHNHILEKNVVEIFIKQRNIELYEKYNKIFDCQELLNNENLRNLLVFFYKMSKTSQEDFVSQENMDAYNCFYISYNRYYDYYNNDVNKEISVKKFHKNPYIWSRNFSEKIITNIFFCSICGTKNIPFILINKNLLKESTRPDYVCPLIYCDKCADIYCTRKIDSMNRQCNYSIPLFIYSDNNKLIFSETFECLFSKNITDDFSNLINNIYFYFTQKEKNNYFNVENDNRKKINLLSVIDDKINILESPFTSFSDDDDYDSDKLIEKENNSSLIIKILEEIIKSISNISSK